MELPLVSVFVLSYNCENFLPEALKGVFAQTYRPLEVIISDNNSSDNSYAVISEIVNSLPRQLSNEIRIVVNRNNENIGTIGNWQKCCELAKGELFVKADGDDYSSPVRVEETVNAWLRNGKQAKIIMCHGVRTDITGKKCVGFINVSEEDLVMGAVGAYAADTYTQFPRIPQCVAYDDQIFTNRALMLAPPLVIDKILVKYRTGGGMTSSRQIDYRAPTVRILKSEIDAYTQLLADLEYIRDRLPVAKYLKFKEQFASKVCMCHDYLKLWAGETFSKRWHGFVPTITKNKWSRSSFASLLALLPDWISRVIFAIWQEFQHCKIIAKYNHINPNKLVGE